MPYAQFRDRYFVVRAYTHEVTTKDGETEERTRHNTYVTSEGLYWLARKLHVSPMLPASSEVA
jgi:hypothetical protein